MTRFPLQIKRGSFTAPLFCITGSFYVVFSVARVVKSVDTRDLNILSPSGEIPEVTPVKIGERPGSYRFRANAEPSPGAQLWEGVESRRRAPKASKAKVKACSRPRTALTLATKAEVVRKSLDLTVVPVRFRPRAPVRKPPLFLQGRFFLVVQT